MAERLWSSNVFRLFSCLLSWGRAPEAHCALWARLGARILIVLVAVVDLLPAVVDLVLVVAVVVGPSPAHPVFYGCARILPWEGPQPKEGLQEVRRPDPILLTSLSLNAICADSP